MARWPDSLLDGSEMGRRIHAFDWSATPLGPIDAWPQSLRSYTSMMLGTSFKSYVFWGARYVSLYNDAFIPVCGAKHPQILGNPSAEAWSEVWDTLGPILDSVRETGAAVTLNDQLFAISRYGFQEEYYCTIAYSPLRDESGAIAGVLATLTETTANVLAQRRIETLRELAARSAEALTERETYAKIEGALAQSLDLPFALVYVCDAPTQTLRLEASVGIAAGDDAAPRVVATDQEPARWPLQVAIDSGEPAIVAASQALPAALVVPLTAVTAAGSLGAIALGLSPRLHLDAAYREFISLAAAQVANMIAGARAFEAERSRADALADIDRAKTAFFNNVSHEFRTPLTLMLGPLEGLLTDHGGLKDDVRTTLSLVHRNAARLQKLVNSLLELSRVDAGGISVQRIPTDVAAFTTGLVSQFRTLVESVGLRYVVDIERPERVSLIDRDMWETIVLNLLSNAYKFTFYGEIGVTLRDDGTSIELCVRDTGGGIAAADLPRIFDRFHRVEQTRSRTHEGTGIGLALVRELVSALGGTVRVESIVGRGTTFTLSIPSCPADPTLQFETNGAKPIALSPAADFLEEAIRWPASQAEAPEPALAGASSAGPSDERPLVVVADDNGDMRDYISRVLATKFRVVVAADGAAALTAIRAQPVDLILSDVMMPVLHGFGLLRTIREDPALRAIPVILVSARAGEGSSVEGFDHGADDYIVKPFSARELLARVDATIVLARLRGAYERERRVASLFQRASLPQALPSVPGLRFDALYEPAHNEGAVGGDWYDAVRLLDGRVVISIGDVAGSGIDAAVTMGNMRQIIRGIAQVHADPVLMLNAADRALRLEHPEVFVTAFVGVLDPVTRTLTYASAGHPPPYVRCADGRLDVLLQTGLPLGLRYGHAENVARTVELCDDALIVLYTDGLMEATRDVCEGASHLDAALRRDDVALATEPALALQRAILGGRPTDDDVAILTVRVGGAELGRDDEPPILQSWTFSVSDAVEAQSARRKLGESLRLRGASLDDVGDAELVFGELVGNIVRYAPGRAEVAVDWSGDLPVLHVLDDGPGFRHIALLPNDLYSESGRGLFLVATLTEDFRVSKRLGGGSHARAVLSLGRRRLAPGSYAASGHLFLDALMPIA